MVNLNQKIDEKISYEEFCAWLETEISVHSHMEQVQIYQAGYEVNASSQLGQALLYQANQRNKEDSVLEQDCLVIDKISENGVAFVISIKKLYEAYQVNDMDVVLDAILVAYGTLERAMGIAPDVIDDAEKVS